MTEPTELLARPFCGSKATASVNKGESLWSHDVVDWTRVHCTNDDCNAQTEATCEGYEPSAVEVWNTRTPQPTQAQAGAVPLTPDQISAMAREYPAEDLCGWCYRMGVADTEAHHGIEGGQHGTE